MVNPLSSSLLDPRQFRNVMGRFASGVTIVTTVAEEQVHGMTANAFISVSLNPPLILVSVDNRANMHRLLSTSNRFGVSILAEGQEELSNHFAGQTNLNLHIPFINRHEMQLIEGAVAHMVAGVVDVHSAGDHTLYVGQVEYIDLSEDKPLLFYTGKYHQLSEKQAKQAAPFLEDDSSMFSLGNFRLSANEKK